MRFPKSKIGLTLSLLYLLGSMFLIASQGLFGESFIAITLGLPWSIFMIAFPNVIGDDSHLVRLSLYIRVLAPIMVNIILFYWIGVGIQKLLFRKNLK